MVDRGILLDRRVGLEGGKEGSREKRGGGERGRGGRGGEEREGGRRERGEEREGGRRERGGGERGGEEREGEEYIGRREGNREGAIPDKTRLRDYTCNEELTPRRCLVLRWRCWGRERGACWGPR